MFARLPGVLKASGFSSLLNPICAGINGSAVALAGANSMSGVRERLKIRRLDKERMRNLAGVSLAGIIPFINVFWGSVATRANAQTSQMDVS